MVVEKISRFLIILLATLFVFGFQVIKVEGDSMYPAIRDGDYLATLRSPYNIVQGSVVLVELNELKLVKRVVAVEGDIVRQRNSVLEVNGIVVAENIGDTSYRSWEIQPGQYFLLGDNTSESLDSQLFGTVSRRDIKGLVMLWSIK